MKSFKDWGWLNGHSKDTSDLFDIQRTEHSEDVKNNKDKHTVLINDSTARGYHHFKCSCGFEYQYDSGD